MKKEWIRQAYETAKEHGFHEVEMSDEHFMMLAVCEVAEAVEAERQGYISEDDMFKVHIMDYGTEGKSFSMSYRRYIKGTVAEEMADVCIRLFDLAGLKGWDVMVNASDVDEMDRLLTVHFAESSFTERAKFLCDMYLCVRQQIDNLMYRVKNAIKYMYVWAKNMGIDLDFHIEMKMRYNKSRIYKHGKKF